MTVTNVLSYVNSELHEILYTHITLSSLNINSLIYKKKVPRSRKQNIWTNVSSQPNKRQHKLSVWRDRQWCHINSKLAVRCRQFEKGLRSHPCWSDICMHYYSRSSSINIAVKEPWWIFLMSLVGLPIHDLSKVLGFYKICMHKL